jgi:hypothetical protein
VGAQIGRETGWDSLSEAGNTSVKLTVSGKGDVRTIGDRERDGEDTLLESKRDSIKTSGEVAETVAEESKGRSAG